ncbi:hypothetical protein jhhlp_001084 [Lomentospora prolificans]|uniref:Translation initiation factor eIF2B subunit gamma n=1 Tax=Lomentospora prolificans TaxID=41688 RepID=A0A2N3NHB7_9PEZI|nr:hypothetical protein jhhlp_001084 [Lomentospora prolificans]
MRHTTRFGIYTHSRLTCLITDLVPRPRSSLTMPHAISAPSPGLQAIILCGPGSSFPTFTANPDENPKALLPIANRPMVWYPIDFCYRMGISDITLICPPSALQAITTALNTNPFLTALPLPRPDVLAPQGLDQNTGTAAILRLPEIRQLVKSDFLILPCDLVCELPGEKFLHAWMTTAASLPYVLGDKRLAEDEKTPLFNGGLGVWYDTKTANPIKGEETDFIATTPLPPVTATPPKGSLLPHVSKLVYSMPTSSLSDLMEERAGLPVRHGLIRNHPRVRMLTTLRDAHIYIFPRWVIDFAQKNDRFDSIGEDITQWWAKAGWEKGLAEKLKLGELFEELGNENGSKRPATQDSSSGPATPFGSENNAFDIDSIPPILAYLHPNEPDAPIIRRVDTARLLLSISLQLAKVPSIEEVGTEAASPFAHPKKVAYPEGVKSRTTITKADSLIAEHVTVEEKTSIKESVIGAHCQIKEGAKMLQCVLMDGVTVGKQCKLTRCIIGKRAVIGDNCVLTDCEIQENLLVEAGTESKDEKLMSSEGLEATEEEMREVLEDTGDDLTGNDETIIT